MGIVADTSVFILCERQNWKAKDVGVHLARLFSAEQIVIPSVVAAEMVHGIYRAKTPQQLAARKSYVDALLSAYPIVSFEEEPARLAGKIRGEEARLGNTLPLADSFIGAIALDLDYPVLTHNVKDFARIPNVRVIPFVIP